MLSLTRVFKDSQHKPLITPAQTGDDFNDLDDAADNDDNDDTFTRMLMVLSIIPS